MREIKFRAWDKSRERMFGVVGIDFSEPHDPCVLLQYTGLKDKNGKEIYEGDIIRAGNEKATPWTVYWNEERLAYYAQQTRDLFIKDPLWEMKTETFYEVIGSIYEHPELLK